MVGAVLGSSVNLNCNFHAYPSDNTSWHHEVIEIHEYGGDYKIGVTRTSFEAILHLTVRNIQPQDFGRYFCSVTNALGNARSSITLYEIKVETTTVASSPTTTPFTDPPTTLTTTEITTTTTEEPTTTDALSSNEISEQEMASLFNENSKRGAEASSRRRTYLNSASSSSTVSPVILATFILILR
ncbi:hypothetical protein GE061_017084 [Apolygus lucorum]|uniref:Uncharacterized protein n=1 Tax=Apolygus lucorum TaxID=248454 RepID=A0A6A4K460_APOLU|nr:hypothetical protein GE061_017084 [Apolygus lucorum]